MKIFTAIIHHNHFLLLGQFFKCNLTLKNYSKISLMYNIFIQIFRHYFGNFKHSIIMNLKKGIRFWPFILEIIMITYFFFCVFFGNAILTYFIT